MKTLTEEANRNLLNLYLPLQNQLATVNTETIKQKVWNRHRRQPIVSSMKNQ